MAEPRNATALNNLYKTFHEAGGRQCFACKDYEYVISNNSNPIIAELKIPEDLPRCGEFDPLNADLVKECPSTNSRCFTLFVDMSQ